jgi:hypothetical protein
VTRADQATAGSAGCTRRTLGIAGSFPLEAAAVVVSIRAKQIETAGPARVCACEENGEIEMPLIQILMVLVVVGVLLWLVNSFIPMQGQIKSILNGVVVIAVVLWLLNIFGLFHSLNHIRIGT